MRTMLREKEHVSLAVLGAIALSAVPGVVSAQCVATTDCASLGYKSSIDAGGCLKCPFGNGYYCPERCEASYQYTCTGANEVKPSSAACSNRYQKCDCNSGYEWNSGACKQCASKYKYTCTGANESKGADSCGGKYSACQCSDPANYEWNSTSGKCEPIAVLGVCSGKARNCNIGQILNSDGTCTTDKVSGKTPIGVVVYIGGDNCGQALALKDLGNMQWSTEYVDIPDLPNYGSVSAVEQDFDSCGNTQKIIKQGSSSTYPAAWAAVNYAPSSVPATKGKWCLPAGGVARSMMNNYSAINSGLSKAGGELLPGLSVHDHWNWSSSEYSNYGAWQWCYACDLLGYGYKDTDNSDYGYVRPVLAF